MKRSQRMVAVALASGIALAGAAGVASAGETDGGADSGQTGSEEQAGPVRGVVDGVDGLLGSVADTVDGVVGGGL